MAADRGMTRRGFGKVSLGVLAVGALGGRARGADGTRLRLGGPVSAKDPGSWVAELKRLGYRAAYCPVGAEADDATVRAYAEAARKADVVIAEVGAWSNPISPDERQRKEALDKCKRQLHLADRIGANCCVNISGSRNAERWAGPHPENLTPETFERIVACVREIVDEVKPTRTYYTLETMPWAFPDTVDAYERLIAAIDRPRVAVHFDPVNLVVSPRVYFFNGRMIREAFERLGPRLRSCHAKDVALDEEISPAKLWEVRPGLGGLDYDAFLRELSRWPDVPLMLEHLPNQEEYGKAAEHIRAVAKRNGLAFG